LKRKIAAYLPAPVLSLARTARLARDRRNRLRHARGLSAIDPKRPVYVFFAPESGLVPHFVAICVIARTLSELGHQVLLVRCSGQYAHCVVMDMFGLSVDKTKAERRQACVHCQDHGLSMATDYGLPMVDLSDLVDEKMLADIKRTIATVPADAGEFEFDGIRIGALCGSDLALSLKTLDQLRATGEARRLLEAYLEGVLVSYRAVQSLTRRVNVARLLHFNEYGMLAGAVMAARRAGIPTMRMSQAVHRHIDRRKIVLLHEPLAIATYHKALDDWPRWRNLALSPDIVASCADSSLVRIGGNGFTVYSPKHAGATDRIYDQLRLDPKRRLLVAFTSSMDEYHSNVNLLKAFGLNLFPSDQPFRDQTEWLEALINHVERSAHLQLIVRIHPREGANAREKRDSEHLPLLRERFCHSYRHVRVIWPQDPTSSYDLSELAEVALTSWSNITLELARFGIPTLTAFKRYVPFPIDDVVRWAPTPSEYFHAIDEMLALPPDLDAIRYAFRWTNVYSLSMSLDFDDVIPTHDCGTLPPFQLSHSAKEAEAAIVHGHSVVAFNRKSLADQQSSTSLIRESEALRAQLRRFVWFLAFHQDRAEDFRLLFGAPGPADRYDMAVTPEGDFVVIRAGDTTLRRRSQTLRRLAQLGANAFAEAGTTAEIA